MEFFLFWFEGNNRLGTEKKSFEAPGSNACSRPLFLQQPGRCCKQRRFSVCQREEMSASGRGPLGLPEPLQDSGSRHTDPTSWWAPSW